MKLNARMRFPHPVLNEHSSDYNTGKFSASFSKEVTDDDQLKITSDLSTDCDELTALIEHQKASAGYFVVCRRTYFNRLQPIQLGKSEKSIDISRLFGRVSFRPVIWTIEDVKYYSSPLINEEFGKDIFIKKGAILAMGPESSFSLDPQKFKPFETIFKLDKRKDLEPGEIRVDPEGDKISIAAEPGTYNSIADMRNEPTGRTILITGVYMPAIMDIVSRLQTDGAEIFESYRWYRVFKAKCDDLSINPSDKASLPLEIAQKLLRRPFREAMKLIQSKE